MRGQAVQHGEAFQAQLTLVRFDLGVDLWDRRVSLVWGALSGTLTTLRCDLRFESWENPRWHISHA